MHVDSIITGPHKPFLVIKTVISRDWNDFLYSTPIRILSAHQTRAETPAPAKDFLDLQSELMIFLHCCHTTCCSLLNLAFKPPYFITGLVTYVTYILFLYQTQSSWQTKLVLTAGFKSLPYLTCSRMINIQIFYQRINNYFYCYFSFLQIIEIKAQKSSSDSNYFSN